MKVLGWILLVLGIIEAGWVVGHGLQITGIAAGASGDGTVQPSFLALVVRAVIAGLLIAGGVWALKKAREAY